MKFSVGYRPCADGTAVDEIIKRREHISEVYFSWGGFPSGRNDQTRIEGMTSLNAMRRAEDDIERLCAAGVRLNLLFNANCYGAMAQSRAFFGQIGETVDHLLGYGLSSVTTTSPLIAKFVKQNFSGVDVRASVNMGIGTVHGMEYVSEYFDSFYIRREKNRAISYLHTLRAWCDKNGKEMYLLANSGCLNDCSAHTFHDNLVAHEREIAAMDNGYAFESVCKRYLMREDKREWLLFGTSFIRPEDIYLYEELVPSMKLATRVHENPVRIMRAYIDRGRYVGNVAELLEPNHSAALYPYILDNTRIAARLEDGRLIYTNENSAFIKLEDNYAYQQNDKGSGT